MPLSSSRHRAPAEERLWSLNESQCFPLIDPDDPLRSPRAPLSKRIDNVVGKNAALVGGSNLMNSPRIHVFNQRCPPGREKAPLIDKRAPLVEVFALNQMTPQEIPHMLGLRVPVVCLLKLHRWSAVLALLVILMCYSYVKPTWLTKEPLWSINVTLLTLDLPLVNPNVPLVMNPFSA